MKKILFFLLISCSFFACSDDDDEMQSEEASLSITKNGQTVAFAEGNHSLIYQDFGVISNSLYLRFEVDGGMLVLAVGNWEWQNPPTDGVLEKSYSTTVAGTGSSCQIIGGADLCDSGALSYQVGDLLYIGDDNLKESFIHITDNDGENKIVSGSFDLEVRSFDDETDIIELNGTFENLTYVIQ